MPLNEVITTSGDIRRLIAQTMVDVKNGNLPVERGLCVAALAKEITGSLQAEVNVAKVRVSMLATGKSMGELTNLGKMIISDDAPTMLSGAS